ncbi:MAG: hypothetical protein AVO34_08055 [Firmicutes bacterium ML8_F2]|nr:MAG: hypothetical protein AVO34_08055 [Firmicutes bacterium ML8_F2]
MNSKLNKTAKKDILIAGVGGQGTILTGRVIAALAMSEGLDVKTAETHGMAQRGGSVITHVRMGKKVYSPLIPQGDGDILLSFEKLEALRWLPFLSPEGTVIVNTQELDPMPVLTGETEYTDGILKEIESKAASLIAVDALNIDPVKKNPRPEKSGCRSWNRKSRPPWLISTGSPLRPDGIINTFFLNKPRKFLSKTSYQSKVNCVRLSIYHILVVMVNHVSAL